MGFIDHNGIWIDDQSLKRSRRSRLMPERRFNRNGFDRRGFDGFQHARHSHFRIPQRFRRSRARSVGLRFLGL